MLEYVLSMWCSFLLSVYYITFFSNWNLIHVTRTYKCVVFFSHFSQMWIFYITHLSVFTRIKLNTNDTRALCLRFREQRKNANEIIIWKIEQKQNNCLLYAMLCYTTNVLFFHFILNWICRLLFERKKCFCIQLLFFTVFHSLLLSLFISWIPKQRKRWKYAMTCYTNITRNIFHVQFIWFLPFVQYFF